MSQKHLIVLLLLKKIIGAPILQCFFFGKWQTRVIIINWNKNLNQ